MNNIARKTQNWILKEILLFITKHYIYYIITTDLAV